MRLFPSRQLASSVGLGSGTLLTSGRLPLCWLVNFRTRRAGRRSRSTVSAEALESRQMLAADLAMVLQNAVDIGPTVDRPVAEIELANAASGVIPGQWIVQLDGLPHGREAQQAAAAQLMDQFAGNQSRMSCGAWEGKEQC